MYKVGVLDRDAHQLLAFALGLAFALRELMSSLSGEVCYPSGRNVIPLPYFLSPYMGGRCTTHCCEGGIAIPPTLYGWKVYHPTVVRVV